MIRAVCFLLFCIAAVGTHRSARAQSVVVVPPLSSEGVPRREVDAFVTQWLTSHDRRIVSFEDQLARELEPCLTVTQTTPPPCAYDYHSRTKADQALVLWVEDDRAFVAIAIEQGLYFSGHARADNWKLALEQALTDARRRETRGLGPWLEVSGFPGEAKVYIDREPVGRLRGPPIRLSEGAHQLEVRADGYRTRYELVSVPTATSHASLTIDLETESTGLTLTHERGDHAAAKRADVTPSPSNTRARWVRPTRLAAGALLAAAGGVLMGRGGWLLSHRERCANSCAAAYPDDAGTVPLVIGAAAASAGLALAAWDLYTYLNAGRDIAVLSVEGRF